ncbi:MAG TPA: ABC transporter permease, partial [Bryobacteraceae bacterium]|nr:ABC transporter permease [Bryobacteraceae bacterium]
MMANLLDDSRYTLRILRKNPGFTLVAVLALALGIGANTAIFSVVNSVLLRPLPYRHPEQLTIVWESSRGQGWNRIGPSGPDFVEFRRRNRSFSDLTLIEAGTGTITGFGEPQQLPGLRVSNNFLSFLGVKVALGRDFTPQEGWNDHVGIISHAIWLKYFGGDAKAIGRRILLDGLPYTVIGVLPANFWSPLAADALVPWVDADVMRRHPMDHVFAVFARLKPGVSAKQASAEITALTAQRAEEVPAMKGWTGVVLPMHEAMVESMRPGLLVLLAAVALVLLIGCSNLANLMLARAAARQREIAIRSALGAGRKRLMGQFLTESSVLALLGGVLGLLLAMWGVDLLQNLVPATIKVAEAATEIVRPRIALDLRALAFTGVVAVVTGLGFGLAPALAAARTDVNRTLKDGGRGSSSGNRTLRRAFVVGEVALALVLLICSMLTIKSFWNLQQVNPGFLADHTLSMDMELPTDSKYREGREQAEFFHRVLGKAESLPGVRSAALTSIVPLDGNEDEKVDFLIEGRPPLPSGQLLPADYRKISPRYFTTMGIPLRHGRDFEARDREDAPRVAIINETLARLHFESGDKALDPIGQRLRIRQRVYEIVGVAGDVRHGGLDKQAGATIYVPYLQIPNMRMSLVLRTAAEPKGMIRAAKQVIYEVDKDQPVFNIRTMQEVLAGSQASPRFTLLLLGVFAGVALLLASLGIYGVISYTVTQRTHEIGIRMALGARTLDVLGMVVGQGMFLTGIGIAAGLTAALAVTRLLSSLLYGVSTRDPLVFGGTSALLAAVALAASLLPARRAAKLDPIRSLRY